MQGPFGHLPEGLLGLDGDRHGRALLLVLRAMEGGASAVYGRDRGGSQKVTHWKEEDAATTCKPDNRNQSITDTAVSVTTQVGGQCPFIKPTPTSYWSVTDRHQTTHLFLSSWWSVSERTTMLHSAATQTLNLLPGCRNNK